MVRQRRGQSPGGPGGGGPSFRSARPTRTSRKGIRITGERLKKKAGKAGAKAGAA